MASSYSSRWLKRKWVIVKKRSPRSPITETNMRFRTKKQAQKEARMLNKGSNVTHLVRKVGWRRKRARFLTGENHYPYHEVA
jgi:hypothetical protein